MKYARSIFFFVLSLAGNLLLVSLFWSALEPQSLGELVAHNGPLVLVAEFLAIYASGATSGKGVGPERDFFGKVLPASREKPRIILVAGIVLAVLLMGWQTEKIWLAFFFTASLFTKYFGQRTIRIHPLTVITIVWFLCSLSIFMIPQMLIGDTFRLLGGLPYTAFGPPQADERIIVWGTVYFVVLAITTSVLYAKEFVRTARTYP